MIPTFPPPSLAHAADLGDALRTHGFCVVTAEQMGQLSGCALTALAAWTDSWNALPPDHYLRDGGRYRRRRHACFTVVADQVSQVPHRPHWQPVEYNALHGGLQRHFEPMDTALLSTSTWPALLRWLGAVCSDLKGAQKWYAEAHQFRIDTTDGIGRPTPEGAHRDGVDLVAVILVARHAIKGGETRVFDAAGPQGQRFTLTEPWSVLLLDDARMIHESTPIQPYGANGHRDTLVLTLRAGGFQGEA